VTKVFVHGNPETDDIWDPLVAELAARGVTDVVRLSPPGFGSPTPVGWGATREDYVAWLVDNVQATAARTGQPVDLVGHDWGAGHVFGLLASHPHMVRSWSADCVGLLHRDYVWHDAAQQWQTPDVGEEAIGAVVGLDEDTFAAVFSSLGMSDPVARAVSRRLDAETARCVLALYRDARQPAMVSLGERFISSAPPHGMVIVAENDSFAGPHENHREIAHAVGAEVREISGAGHWWMNEAPERAADLLIAHWASIG
jgi:pimeloyl-ACP methyl ester carboxylesterase